jgi:hypothetical protein
MLKKKYDEITVEHGEKKGPNWYAYPDGSKRKKSDANATKTSGKDNRNVSSQERGVEPCIGEIDW